MHRENRLKRRAYIVELSSEMEQCIPAVNDVESYVDGVEIGRVISTFLRKQPKEKRIILCIDTIIVILFVDCKAFWIFGK